MKINFERIKYSPLGKRIMNRFKASIILGLAPTPLMLLICLIGFGISVPSGVIWTLITLTISAIIIYSSVKGVLFQARLLSDMTDREHETLIAEYKKYEEKNIIRYGHLTSYGIILDNGILPWRSIDEIKFSPGEYRQTRTTHGWTTQYYPAKITVYATVEKKSVTMSQSLSNEDYDLSNEIERFIDSIPKYTEHRFLINNNYYPAK